MTDTDHDTDPCSTPTVVSDEEWITARLALLEEEKALSKLTMNIATKRAALPWRVVQDYPLEYVKVCHINMCLIVNPTIPHCRANTTLDTSFHSQRQFKILSDRNGQH